MLFIINNYLPLLITIFSIFGLMVHDTHVDKAFARVFDQSSAVVSNDSGFLKVLHSGEHIHVRSVALDSYRMRTIQPSAQSKSDIEKKYIAAKRSKNSSFGTEYMWPTT